MKKSILLSITVKVLAIIILNCGCNSQKASNFTVNPAFGEYISAFTTGYISSESSIRIILTDNVKLKAGKLPIEGLFDFSPDISGKTFWIDNRTIEFKPDKKLSSDQFYKANFNLSKIADIPAEFNSFEFTFNVIPQSVDVYIDGIKTTDKKTLSWQRLMGSVSTADVADFDEVKKVVTARQNGKNLNIIWENTGERTMFRFIVDSIRRTEQPGKLEILWNNDVLGLKQSGIIEYEIPSLSDFKVLDVKVFHEPDQYAVLQFSDPIMENQNLEGLIHIAGISGFKLLVEDNEVKVYPSANIDGSKIISVEPGVKNILGRPLKTRYSMEIAFEEIKPAIQFTGKGNILPTSTDGFVLPFEAVNLRAVDVKVVKVFENNIQQFLQINNMDGSLELHRVGKTVFKRTIMLSSNPTDLKKWNTYSLDLSKLVKTELGAIYQVQLDFKKDYSTFGCGEGLSKLPKIETAVQEEEEAYTPNSTDDYYDNGGYWDEGYDDYEYSQKDNPCHESYYMNRGVVKNIFASSLGLIAKRGADGSSNFYVTDLQTTAAIPNTTLEVYDYQKQLLVTLKTDSEGSASTMLQKKPFLLVAKSGQQRGYLKLDDGNSLSVSMFDIKGDVVQKGIKGFIYGERSVWRPGDSLFLSFMMEGPKNLPQNHPVSFELFDPHGKLVKKIVKTNSANGLYAFSVNTNHDAPTGNYLAKVKVGGASFSKTLKIETIMPNRLKINLNFGAAKIMGSKGIVAELETRWLHGAIARNLTAKVELSLLPTKTTFNKFDDYVFDDPTKSLNPEPQVIFDGKINEYGKAQIKHVLPNQKTAPGILKAEFNTRVFEEGGNASIDKITIPYSPYSHYVGIKIPEGDKYSGKLNTDTDHKVQIATLDEEGRPVSRKKIKVQVFKVHWKWWWESNSGDLQYINNNYYKAIQSQEISSVSGKAVFNFRINRPEWGRYLILVTDMESGHSTGNTVYIDWPNGSGTSTLGTEGPALLSFTMDKEKYIIGEKVKLSIPSSAGGRALISVENGSQIIQSFWVITTADKTEAEFMVSPAMAPNVYVNITLIQPYAQSKNDLPIRLYGILPLQVEDPNTFLKPIIKTANSWKPEEKAYIKVSEENGKEMNYTLAIVDEGLLDITRFKTPDPWSSFYSKEALGVKTWDLFEMVIGTLGAKSTRILALGGDGDAIDKGGKKAQRFKPMVRYLGPFNLKAGKTANHEIFIPQYIGAVRVMVVAGHEKAYGSSEKSIQVKRPLMVLGTLPRVIGPAESFDLPVTVFAMEKNIKNVAVEIMTNEIFSIDDNQKKSISFNEPGDEVINFKLRAKNNLGIGKIKIVVSSGSEKAVYESEIDVRNPNSRIVQVIDTVIEAGKTWNTNYSTFGTAGTNNAVLEFSSIPPLNLGERLKYLIAYPHGCVEQLTSSVFPQLYLADIMELNPDYKSSISNHIKTAIQNLRAYQNSTGGFAYWPGSGQTDDWGTSYAGHFLLEAEAKGYSIPQGMLENWKKYQKQAAQNWSFRSGNPYNDDLIQAYRLYSLALANTPELGAMNRLKEAPNISLQAKWRLSAAYALSGQPETAKKLVVNLSPKVNQYREMAYTYGSGERDEAMILETYMLLGDKAKAAPLAKSISKALNQQDWMSTQTTAWCLLSVSKFAAKNGSSSSMAIEYAANGKNGSLNSKLPVTQVGIPIKNSNELVVKNKGAGLLFARIILEGVPLNGEQISSDNRLSMTVNYKTITGQTIDVEKLDQGMDFVAEVTIKNPSVKEVYKQMALSQVFPSGWEIRNMRVTDSENSQKSDTYTYQDIRDDRVYTYFNIPPGQSLTYRVLLNAAYVGKFYLPSVYCEAMYDNTINATRPGKWVEVHKKKVEGLIN